MILINLYVHGYHFQILIFMILTSNSLRWEEKSWNQIMVAKKRCIMIWLTWWSHFSKKQNFITSFHYVETMVTKIRFRVSVFILDELGDDVIFYIMPFTWIPIPSVFMHPFIPNPNWNLCRVEMTPLNCFEISGPELVESNPEAAALFDQIG